MGKHLELTPRLRQIAAWVRQGAHLADVGTDHAYLPVWLTLQGRVASAIASDLRRGPLDRAQETGRRYGVGDRITFRLGNGLAAVAPEECDTIVIAGMGGENIAQILAGHPGPPTAATPCCSSPRAGRRRCAASWRSTATP